MGPKTINKQKYSKYGMLLWNTQIFSLYEYDNIEKNGNIQHIDNTKSHS